MVVLGGVEMGLLSRVEAMAVVVAVADLWGIECVIGDLVVPVRS